jgi:7-cyano-7-deazaguanine synthase in queuosine biosynthesis
MKNKEHEIIGYLRTKTHKAAPNKKTVLCSFTGGLDSTTMVYGYLLAGYNVNAVYGQGFQNKSQIDAEKVAIDKIINYFIKEFGNRITLSYSRQDPVTNPTILLQQVPSILYGLLGHMHQQEEVAIGYVLRDCAISFLKDIRNIWKSFGYLHEANKISPLVFPLIKQIKSELKLWLPSELYEMISFCEFPDEEGKPCGVCTSCERMKRETGFVFKPLGLEKKKASNVVECDEKGKSLTPSPAIEIPEVKSKPLCDQVVKRKQRHPADRKAKK